MSQHNHSPKFKIHYYKHKPIHLKHLEKSFDTPTKEDIDIEYNPFYIKGMQSFNPIYKHWFSLNETNFNRIALNHKYHIKNMTSVVDISDNVFKKPVFIKYSPLLDPVRYMVGKYESNKDILCNLPNINNTNTYPKINDQNNMSYVDCFFSYLSSQLLNTHNSINSIDFYGSFIGIQDKHKIDISDDYEYLQSSPFFISNNKNLFTVFNIETDNYYNYSSHANKQRLCISNTPKHNISAISVNNIDNNDDISIINIEDTLVYTNPTNSLSNNSSKTST